MCEVERTDDESFSSDILSEDDDSINDRRYAMNGYDYYTSYVACFTNHRRQSSASTPFTILEDSIVEIYPESDESVNASESHDSNLEKATGFLDKGEKNFLSHEMENAKEDDKQISIEKKCKDINTLGDDVQSILETSPRSENPNKHKRYFSFVKDIEKSETDKTDASNDGELVIEPCKIEQKEELVIEPCKNEQNNIPKISKNRHRRYYSFVKDVEDKDGTEDCQDKDSTEKGLSDFIAESFQTERIPVQEPSTDIDVGKAVKPGDSKVEDSFDLAGERSEKTNIQTLTNNHQRYFPFVRDVKKTDETEDPAENCKDEGLSDSTTESVNAGNNTINRPATNKHQRYFSFARDAEIKDETEDVKEDCKIEGSSDPIAEKCTSNPIAESDKPEKKSKRNSVTNRHRRYYSLVRDAAIKAEECKEKDLSHPIIESCKTEAKEIQIFDRKKFNDGSFLKRFGSLSAKEIEEMQGSCKA